MSEIPDSQLLWRIHFDRQNYTAKWIKRAEAEAEAERRGITLHKIDDDYRKDAVFKEVSETFDSDVNISYPFFRRWWREWLVGLSLYTFDLILGTSLHWTILSLLKGILGAALIYRIYDGEDVPKIHKIVAWIIVAVLILIGFIFHEALVDG